jgi:hypothetical protein
MLRTNSLSNYKCGEAKMLERVGVSINWIRFAATTPFSRSADFERAYLDHCNCAYQSI